MEKKLLGELFGVQVYTPITRDQVRKVVQAKNQFVQLKSTNDDLTYHQALLNAGDIVESFTISLDNESSTKFLNLYSEEVVVAIESLINTDYVKNKTEAEIYHLQASFIFNELDANLRVYGANSVLVGATPANIDLALEYINRSIQLEPENPIYLNLKGLLIWHGLGDKVAAKPYIEKAAKLDPKNTTIQNNLKSLEDSNGCFIATAAFGTPMAYEVDELRLFRDVILSRYIAGRVFIKTYYKLSPPVAKFISKRPFLKRVVRALLKPVILWARQITLKKHSRVLF